MLNVLCSASHCHTEQFHCPEKHALYCTYSDFSPSQSLAATALFLVSLLLLFPEDHVMKSYGMQPFQTGPPSGSISESSVSVAG